LARSLVVWLRFFISFASLYFATSVHYLFCFLVSNFVSAWGAGNRLAVVLFVFWGGF
jgi:hypothetical protein